MIRRALLAVGAASTTLGVVALAVPRSPSLGPVALVFVLLVLLTVSGMVAIGRLSNERERPTPLDGGGTVTVPGDDFDERLRSIPAYSDRGADERAAVRERLREVAVDRLVSQRGVSPATARERLDAGTWTDDPEAAALFTDRPPSASAQLRALLGGPSAFERRVARAVAVLAEGDDA